MRTFVRNKKLCLIFLLVWISHVTWVPCALAQQAVTVPAGTRVVVAFKEGLSPMTAVPGQKLTLEVVNPVVIDGVTVIEAGAAAMGEVTQAQRQGAVGKPAIIGVAVTSVTAVDGTNIPLSGQKVIEGQNKQTTSLVITIVCCILGLLMKGGDAQIVAGSQVDATTVGVAKVNA